MSRPLPWSHSALSGFDTCPRQYEEIKVLRNYQDKKNDASLWGDEFHKAAEAYIGAGGGELPANMEKYRGYLGQFLGRPGTTLVEQELGLNEQLQPCEFLGDDDIGYLYDAIWLIPFELGLRFLTDHFAGDRYFKVAQPGQNLVRARVQFRLTEEIERREPALRSLIESAV